MSLCVNRFYSLLGISSVSVLSCLLSVAARGQDDSQEAAAEQSTEVQPAPTKSTEEQPAASKPTEQQPTLSKPSEQQSTPTRPGRKTQLQKKMQSQKNAKTAEQLPSALLPDWPTAAFGIELRPVLGFQYSKRPLTNKSVLQGEIGAFIGVNGLPVVAGNPGFQVEPGFGYAVGQAAVEGTGLSAETGTYARKWGEVRTPIYWRFLRQVFHGKYGEVSGGPLPVSKRASFQSDSGVLVVKNLSAHYTLTYDRAYGADASTPELNSYDHWLHARLQSSMFSFFVDGGPGYSTSTSSQTIAGAELEAKSSGAYLLGLSGFDLLTDKIGFEAAAKYMLSSSTDTKFNGTTDRSPLQELGGQESMTSLPSDSLHVSAFFGIRRLVGIFGVGYRYSLQILNYSERNNTKQQKTETSGLGIHASVRF